MPTAAGDEAALLRALAADPDDDAVRLVFADWLDDHDRPAEAECVRLQVAFAALVAVEGEFGGFERSLAWEMLSSRCEAAAIRHAVPATPPIECRRGLPAVVVASAAAFVDHGPLLFAALPTLHGLRVSTLGRSHRAAQRLAAAEHLRRITRLSVEGGCGPAALAALLASPHLANVTDLDLHYVYLRNAAALATATLPRLTRLTLYNTRLGDARLADLLRTPLVDRLTYLDLEGCTLREPSVHALAASPRLAALTTLRLGDNRVSDAGVKALAASDTVGGLVNLGLDQAHLRAPAAAALARSTTLTALRRLGLAGNPLGDAGVRALVAGRGLAGLEHLDLEGTDLTAAGVAALAAADALPNIQSLALNDEIGHEGVYAVARSTALAGLRTLTVQADVTGSLAGLGSARMDRLAALRLSLGNPKAALAACAAFGAADNLDLQGNALGNAGVVALAAMPELRKVVRLDLSFNRFGDVGARALAASPYLENLEELVLHYNSIGPSGFAALVAGLPRLTRLVVGSNPVKTAGLKRLAASPEAARLRSLGLWFIEADDPGVAALAKSRHLTDLRHLDLANNPVTPDAAIQLMQSPNFPRLASLRIGMSLSADQFETLRWNAARQGIKLHS